MHRHLRHVHSPDAFDSMANESKRKQAPQASSGRAWQAEEAMPGVPPQNWSQAIFARFWPSSVRNFGNFPPESIGIFRPLGCFDRHHLNFFAQFRPVVLCQYLDIQDLTLVSRECTVSGLESILVFQSQTKHCITSSFATGRFCPSPVRKFPLESIWIFRPLGCFERHHAKKFGLISCRRTLSGPWHTGLSSGLP